MPAGGSASGWRFVDTRAGFEDSFRVPGDPGWRQAHKELLALHVEKSATYGSNADPLANFSESAAVLGKPAEYAVLVRVLDKVARAVHMIDAGKADLVKEYPDVASLALCAEALLRRRTCDPAQLRTSPAHRWPVSDNDPGDETE